MDDYHLITDESIQNALSFLISNLPENFHIIIATRADPPWPYGRMRARGEITEIRANDLRFTLDEVVQFLNHVMGFNLSREDIALLEKRTEGWIAGLQMAALSMQGREDLSGFVRTLSGSHRFIMDYLVEEVIDKQTREIQEFIIKTSILDRMNSSICDRLTDSEGSQEILNYLEHANLFLVPLDDERCWYRYHQLFAELLRSYQEQYRPGRAPKLHVKASEWYEEQGLIADAVEHAHAAGDINRVVNLLEGNAIAMMDHGRLQTLKVWLDTLPLEMIHSRPWLCICYAWILVYTGQLEAIEPLIRDAEKGLSSEKGEKSRQIYGHIAAIRAYCAELQGDLNGAISYAQEALEHLPEQDLRARCFALTKLSASMRLIGDFSRATETFNKVMEISQAIGDCHFAINAHCDMAGLLMMQGQLRKVHEITERCLRLAKEHFKRSGYWLPVTGYAYARLSQVLYEWNDIETAIGMAREAVRLSTLGGLKEYMADSYVFLAMALQAKGDDSGALRAIRNAMQVAGSISPWYIEIVEPYEAHIRFVQGEMSAASQLVDEKDFIRKGDYGIEYFLNNLIRARILVTQVMRHSALLLDGQKLVNEIKNRAEEGGANHFLIQALVLESLLYQTEGKIDAATQVLERAFSLAEPEGYVRCFIDLGKPVGELLKQAAMRGIHASYVKKLLEALEAVPWVEAALPTEPMASLAETFSERELQVLRMLQSELSAPEIADELVVAVSTVRSHIKSIYSKLDVHSRLEAIERSKELKIL